MTGNRGLYLVSPSHAGVKEMRKFPHLQANDPVLGRCVSAAQRHFSLERGVERYAPAHALLGRAH